MHSIMNVPNVNIAVNYRGVVIISLITHREM